MNFIKKIVDGNVDESVHLQFQKFSKGEFRDRALIEAKSMAKGRYSVKTSAEFANGLVRVVAKKLGEGKTNVKGAIVSTNDLTGELDFKDKKQFQGVKRYLIDKEMSGSEIVGLLDKFPKTFFALTFEAGETKLKIKPKAPKSGKPGKGDKKAKADFCTLRTDDKRIAENFVFEKPDFKKAEINHTFFIEGMVIPDELKDSDDFARIREESRRKGRIVRIGEIDGEEIKREIPFEA
ncbi:hypothetical protein GOV13_01555 [Candidatus Pacearchaeota archaeon]|nr:hypothetical protein [Candidatus Pacearchaeota archaeon]